MKPTYKILVVEVEQDLGTGRVAIEASDEGTGKLTVDQRLLTEEIRWTDGEPQAHPFIRRPRRTGHSRHAHGDSDSGQPQITDINSLLDEPA